MRNKPKVMTSSLTTRTPLQHNIAKSVRKEWLSLGSERNLSLGRGPARARALGQAGTCVGGARAREEQEEAAETKQRQ